MAPVKVMVMSQKKGGGKRKKTRKLQNAVRTLQMVTLPKSRKRRPRPQQPTGRAYGAVQQFRLAQRDPFHPDALGVRVVDSICYPTTVSHIRFKATCTTTASGTFQAVLLPFLHANMINIAGSAVGNPGVYANNTSVGYVTTATSLKTYFSCYRVAAWGVRIILTDSNQNAKGTYTVAPVMLAGSVPGPSALGTAASGTAAILAGFGVATPVETIASLPSAVAINAQDLMTRGELIMRGLTYLPTAYNMKVVQNDATAWNTNLFFTQGVSVWNSSTFAVSNVETSGMFDANGQIAYLLSVANAPASTAEFQLEFVYHLEGIPQPSSGVVMTSTPSPAGSTSTIEKVTAAMVSAGEYFQMGTTALDKLGGLGTAMYKFNRARARRQVMLVD